ncbi:unnamed protein product [Auanema sp. JU1783]|nr:unnamed protein product [Auanema sp. JU1783]
MIAHLIVALSLVSLTSATALADDFNCTDADGNWAASAVSCDNVLSDAVCDTLVINPPAIQVGTKNDDRAPLCKVVSNNPNEEQKQAMISICPKTCGYCCLTPQYSCRNKDLPAMNCATIKPAQCKDPKWREVIASECPNACGFCLEGGCVDAIVQCANDITICRNIDLQDFVRDNCKKTCGFCTNSGISTTRAGCMDNGNNCVSWKNNGFCNSTFYSDIQKRQYCARSCNLC